MPQIISGAASRRLRSGRASSCARLSFIEIMPRKSDAPRAFEMR